MHRKGKQGRSLSRPLAVVAAVRQGFKDAEAEEAVLQYLAAEGLESRRQVTRRQTLCCTCCLSGNGWYLHISAM